MLEVKKSIVSSFKMLSGTSKLFFFNIIKTLLLTLSVCAENLMQMGDLKNITIPQPRPCNNKLNPVTAMEKKTQWQLCEVLQTVRLSFLNKLLGKTRDKADLLSCC